MSDNSVTVTIKTQDISPKNLKKIQKVKAELEKEIWQKGNTWEKAQIVEYFPRQILKQDLNLLYTHYDDLTSDHTNLSNYHNYVHNAYNDTL